MQLHTREDIEAPIDYVFAQVTDFSVFERQALRRGADVRRIDSLARPDVGSAWQVTFKYRGKDRTLNAEVVRFDMPNSFVVSMASGGVTGETLVDLVPLARGRTRLTVSTEMEANGLTARLLLQSLKLAKGTLTKRMGDRVYAYARDISERFARQNQSQG